MDEHMFAALRAQEVMRALSDDSGKPRKSEWSGLMDHCLRARNGESDGIDFSKVPF